MKRRLTRFCTLETGILCISAILLFANLGLRELNSADEAIHAQVAREMAVDGHWLYPTYRGEPYLEKPPLKFWLTAITYKIVGISEFTARFWSALFGLGTIWVVMRLGKKMFNRSVGLLSALVLLTTWEFLFNHCARTGELDSALLFFTLLAVTDLWTFRTTESTQSLYASAVWFAFGFLTKGHVALIPLLWIPFVWRGRKNGFKLSRTSLLFASLIFIGIISPWFVVQLAHYGKSYLSYNFHHNFLGYLGGDIENAQTSGFYYLQRILWLDYPWPPLIALGAIVLFEKSGFKAFPRLQLAREWLLSWIIVQSVLLTVSQTKLPWYHLPLWIPFSLLSGIALERMWKSSFAMGQEAWDRIWLYLHLGFFLCLTGFLVCVWEYLFVWYSGYRQEIDNFVYYFFKDSQQRSVFVGLSVLPIGLLSFFFRRFYRGSSSLEWMEKLRKIQVIGFISIALFFILHEIRTVEPSENARQTVNEAILKFVKPGQSLKVHVFDPYQERAPHYRIPASFYFYLASVPYVKITHHLAAEEQWNDFLGQENEPCIAVVPSEWLDSNTSKSYRLLALRDVKKTRIVYIEGKEHTPLGRT
jgi:4-amino-4-deoxy-L-arabinose transferase-like glycosyltransferase